MRMIVTGGAGFIGSAFVRKMAKLGKDLLILDKMTYASSYNSIRETLDSSRAKLVEVDICSETEILGHVLDYGPNYIVHFAAETHVDNSIATPSNFIQTNIIGTYNLLKAALAHWNGLNRVNQKRFRFHHISTDEVYGDLPHPEDLGPGDSLPLFSESNQYRPSSPYSASKAASDHLVLAWYRTYGLPITISNCSNNYGSYQNAEKLLPKTILNALSCSKIPIYGCGRNIRDWLYVDDHVEAINLILCRGTIGETYNIGSSCEMTNLEIVKLALNKLEELAPIKTNANNSAGYKSYLDLITFVKDRAGHDLRYAINSQKIRNELGWHPTHSIEEGLEKMISFYVKSFLG